MEHLLDAHIGETAGPARPLFRNRTRDPWRLTKNADTNAANPGERRVAHERVVSRGASASGIRTDHTRPKPAAPDAGASGLGYRELAAGKDSARRIRREMNCGIPLSERQAGQILLGSLSDHEQSDTEEKSHLFENPARG